MRKARLTWFLFTIYLLILTWIILLKMETDLLHPNFPELQNINLIPFGDSVITNGRLDTTEIFLNGLAFVPVGIYLRFLKPDWRWWQITLVCGGLSLSYEFLQYLFAIGASDITDLIMNTSGGLLGVLIAGLLQKVTGKNSLLVVNLLASLCTIGLLALFLILIVANH